MNRDLADAMRQDQKRSAFATMTERKLLQGVADAMLIVRIMEYCKEQRQKLLNDIVAAESRGERKVPNELHGKRRGFYEIEQLIKKLQKGREDMLTTFEIRVTADMDTSKPDDVAVFKELLTQEGQILYTQVTTMAPGSHVEVSMSNLEEGAVQLKLFSDKEILPE